MSSEIKKIILDTDIGVDCDDAAALAILLNAHKRKECVLLGITNATTREGASALTKIICKYYGVDVPVAVMKSKPLPCDSINNYSRVLKQKYQENDVDDNAIDLLRKLLSEANEKVTIIAIGPLVNIAGLLNSKADQYSELSGMKLVKEKVQELYVMGAAFNNKIAEWNILQDIESARMVVDKWPTKIIFSPHEVGNVIKTKMMNTHNPVWESMAEFAISTNEKYEKDFYRQSWDPITCLLALGKYNHLFNLSKQGKVFIDEKGFASFRERKDGLHSYILLSSQLSEIEKVINISIEKE